MHFLEYIIFSSCLFKRYDICHVLVGLVAVTKHLPEYYFGWETLSRRRLEDCNKNIIRMQQQNQMIDKIRKYISYRSLSELPQVNTSQNWAKKQVILKILKDWNRYISVFSLHYIAIHYITLQQWLRSNK